MNGKVLFSQKRKIVLNRDFLYWAALDMHDFMPSVTYEVPVEGDVDALPMPNIRQWILGMEESRDPHNMLDVHVEAAGQCLIDTIGCYAT